jgi:uncharacterized protein (DUF934 family)
MLLNKTGKIVEDAFVRVADDAALPDGVAVLISAARFLADPEAILRREAPTGVVWPNNRNVEALASYLDRLALVALDFPKFRDGRAYSQARILRERFRFRGELRATGDVLRDQFLFLIRSGFDVFDVKKEIDALAFAEAVSRYSVFYQPAADGRQSVFRQRLLRATEGSRLLARAAG